MFHQVPKAISLPLYRDESSGISPVYIETVIKPKSNDYTVVNHAVILDGFSSLDRCHICRLLSRRCQGVLE